MINVRFLNVHVLFFNTHLLKILNLKKKFKKNLMFMKVDII